MVIKIGHAAPLTGGIAHLGKDNENGARLAIDEANAKGISIDGKKVKFLLVPEDDEGVAIVAVQPLLRTEPEETGVILEDGGKVWSVLNVRGLAIPEFAGRVAEPVVYEGETPAARIARRKAKWTPTEIVYR